MYKTIRHGENSLQYTILPQNDDFRIEGKLTSAESSCSSESGSRKPKAKRPKRRSFFAYIGLIFVCTVIVGAVLIPFLVSAECLPNPKEWFLKTKAALTKNGSKNQDNHVIHYGINGANERNLLGNGINIGKTVKIINKNGVERIILRVNKTDAHEKVKTANDSVPEAVDKPMQNIINATNLNKINENDVKITTSNDEVTITESVAQLIEPKIDSQLVADNSEQTGANAVDVPQPVPIHNEIKDDFNDKNSEDDLQNGNGEPQENFITEVRFDAIHPMANHLSPASAPTIVVTTLRNPYNNDNVVKNEMPTKSQSATVPDPAIIRPTLPLAAASVNTGRLISSNPAQNPTNQNQNNTGSALPTIMTRIIQVPLLKSAAKKPIIPPVLVKTNSQLSTNKLAANENNGVAAVENNENYAVPPDVEQTQNSDWIHSHWPYIDPSTYFQWTGYKAEDSVLLPALLGFALIGVILIVTVCLVARNKRTIVSSVRKRNRNDIEETGAEDNATLLTTNLSDED